MAAKLARTSLASLADIPNPLPISVISLFTLSNIFIKPITADAIIIIGLAFRAFTKLRALGAKPPVSPLRAFIFPSTLPIIEFFCLTKSKSNEADFEIFAPFSKILSILLDATSARVEDDAFS